MNNSKKITSLFFFSLCLIIFFQNCSNFSTLSSRNSFSNNHTSFNAKSDQLSRGLASPNLNTAISGDGSIAAQVFGSELKITTTNRLQGAIGSLTFRGKEFINQDDHGRELQSAASYDGFGECMNPTEAGSEIDGRGPTSTSRLLAYQAQGNRLSTAIQMAYWLQGNQSYKTQNNGQGCGNNPNLKIAQHTANLSNDILLKQVTIGYSNLQNVIEYLVQFRVAEFHKSATFEALTGYMTTEFSTFYGYNTNTDQLVSIESGSGEQEYPVIFSTSDRMYAMGIYSPDLPTSSSGFGRANLFQDNTMKWNAVYRRAETPPGDYSFRQYVIVGTVAEVQSSMKMLNYIFHPKNIPVPIGLQNNYRFLSAINGEHFITTLISEGISMGYIYEGLAFNSLLISSTDSRAIVLYRCVLKNVGHFASVDPKCEGQITEGDYGKIYSSQVPNSLPLYRFNSLQNGDHLTTTNYNEGISSGYKFEGILGYAPTPN